MPYIFGLGTSAAELSHVDRPELVAPAVDALVGDDDATLEHQFLNAAITEREAIVEAHARGDDLGRLAVAAVGRGGRLHGRHLSHSASSYPVTSLM
jgi:hypothetical protein